MKQVIDKYNIIYFTVLKYCYTIFLVNQFLGMALVPIIIFIAYGPKASANIFIYLGGLLFLLMLI